MKYLKLTAPLFVLVSSNLYGQGQTLRGQTLMHDGVQRTYELYVPSTYSPDQAWPLVLNLHGYTGNGPGQMSLGMNVVAEREGFLVAYPSAINGNWMNSRDSDVGFIDSLLDEINSAYNVDTSRVYATGLSQGGIMSYILGAERPETFAAIASVSGVRFLDSGDTLFPSDVPRVPPRALPLLHIHGTADGTVPFDGGDLVDPQFTVTFPSVQSILNEWLANNSCKLSPLVTELPDPKPDDNLTVTLLSYEDCSSYTGRSNAEHTAEVQFYRINGGGHVWPTAPRTLDANTEIWNFFSRHELPASGVQEPALVAGDADQDLDFDQLDLVQVQVAAKYLTGQTATWGEGDWNGAPGGSRGNPPAGDGTFNQLDIVAAQQAGRYMMGPYAAVSPNGQRGGTQTSIIFEADAGELSADGPAGKELTSVNIDLAARILTGNPAQNVGGIFGSVSFGSLAQAGMSEEFIPNDLGVFGSLAGSGDLGDVELLYVPEPSTIGLFTLGLLVGLWRFPRKA